LAFNISSLKNHFDPTWYKQELAKALAKKLSKKVEKNEEKKGVEALESMKETHTETQKNML